MCQLAVGFSQAAPERWLGHRVWHHFSSESPLLLLSLIHCYVWITNGINETITNSCERFCNECHWLCISFPSTFYMLLWSNGVIALHSTGLANPNSSTGRPGNWAGHSPVKAQKLGYMISRQNMEVPVSIFQESPLAGEPRERLFHIHSVHRYQTLCIISIPIYVIVTNKLLQPLTTTWYDSLVLSFSLLKI